MAEVNNFASKFDILNHLRKVLSMAKKLLYDEKALNKSKNKLLSISPQKIEALVRKYKDNTPKLQKKLRKTFKILTEHGPVFLREFTAVFKELDQITVELEREEFDDLKKIENIINKWLSYPRPSVFTKGIVSDLEKEFQKFQREISKFVGRDIRDDSLLQRGRQPRTGFMNKFRSEFALSRRVKKMDKKAMKRELKTSSLEQEIEQQLSHGIQLNFPYLFSKFLHEEGVLEAVIHEIRSEVKQIIKDNIKDFNEVNRYLGPVCKMLSGYPEFKGFAEKVSRDYIEFKSHGAKAEEFVQHDYRDQKTIGNELYRDRNIFNILISHLRAHEHDYEQNKAA